MVAKKNIDDLKTATVVNLVIAAQADNRAAFGELFERYNAAVTATAYRQLGDANEAQEVCQDVFIKAMEKIHQLRVPECFGSWLKSIARRTAINRAVRRGPVIPVDPVNLASNCSDEPSAEDTLLAHEREDHVHAGLSRLKELDRATLTSFYIEGHSLREMSVEFDAPLGTIKRRLHTARKRLEQEVEELMAV